jgi:Fe2+ or Zn2+ uptake regulation protein
MAVPAGEAARRARRLSRGNSADETHPDVEAEHESVHERLPTISLDTVYRTLPSRAERWLIARVSFAAGPARYDAGPPGATPHTAGETMWAA